MAAVVQSSTRAELFGNAANPAACLPTFNAGNTLIGVISVAVVGGNMTPTGITGANFTLAGNAAVFPGDGSTMQWFESNSSGGAKTVQITFGNTCWCVFTLLEVSGLDASPVKDSFATVQSNSNLPGTGNLTIAHTGIAIASIAAGTSSNPIGMHVPAGYTNFATEQDAGSVIGASHDYKLITSGNTVGIPATTSGWGPLNAAEDFSSLIVMYSDATGTQILTPNADKITGNWSASAGTTLFGVVDESNRSDSDYAYLIGSNSSTFRVGLSNATDPLISTNHVLSYAISGMTGNISVRLVQDANTTIASWGPHATLAGAYTEYDQTLSNTQADAISNYANLSIEFTAG